MEPQQQQQHAPGGHYSGHNPIPTVRQFVDNLDKDKRARDKKLDEQAANNQQPATQDAKPHQQAERQVKGTEKTVTDPTTGREVVIADVNKDMINEVENPYVVVPNANLDKDTPIKTDASQSLGDYKYNQDVTAPPDPVAEGTTTDVPIHGEKTNVLFHPTPSVSFEPMFAALETRANMLCVGILVTTVVVGKIFGGALKGLIPLGMCLASGVYLWMKEVIRSGREVEWDSEKVRGQMASLNLLPESVEWMNTLLGIVWGLINPEMFSGVADTLEDVMQASVPGVIENVRVAEINQGSNPLRILSLRALPDSHMGDMKQSIHEENKRTKDPQEAAADEEGGDYYNLEISFAYHASPSGKRVSERARNMHMQLVFYLGIKGLFGVPLPIFVELQGLVGTVRLRLNMTPEPPFLKTLTFTLMGAPQVTAGCTPMVEKGVNILNLPLISNFVNYAIKAAASMYVAPKSMSIDMRAILQGDSVQKDTEALGVLWIRIHRAVGLSKQDRRGSKHGGSDPYITIAFSKYGKPMYCTRVITDDLNPIWEETTAVLVGPELIKANENLSVELWDSDRHSADDIVGKVEISMQKMIQHPGKMYPQTSKLAGMEADSEMPGELHWEVGYFSKPKFRKEMRTDGKNKALPDELKDHPALQDEKGVINSEEDDAVMHTPPDPLWPSGICSVIVHQIVNLELENIKGSEDPKGREYEPAKPYGEGKEEVGGNLPTSYCTILFNDELVYRTRAKAVSSQPIFNAGTERFIRDWRSAIVTITARDQRNREHDPILGVVPLKLSDILETSSQVTRWYPLDGGIGFGRIRISLLFRSIETRLPPQMLGWDVGTFEFRSQRILAVEYGHHPKLRMRTGGSTGKISRNAARKLSEGDGSPIVFEFHIANHRKADAYAVIWLQHFIDNEDADINIPIWKTAAPARITQNYITEENCHKEPGLEDLQEVGRLQFRARFKAGTDDSHAAFVTDNDTRETYETWEACVTEGVRNHKVEKELPDRVQELHEKSLVAGRDILKNATEEEKRRWLAKDGQDWSGAFGDNPKAYMNTRRQKRREPGVEEPLHDRHHPSDNEDNDDSDDDYGEGDSSSDIGVEDAETAGNAKAMSGGSGGGNQSKSNGQLKTQKTDLSPTDDHLPRQSESTARTSTTSGTDDTSSSRDINKQNKRAEERKHRGLMQWKPARNVKFAKDEAKIGLSKLKKRVTGGLDGRQPGVETETG
ncbi:meiotically up-regulated gene 190 protein [Pyrenophora tritici-repentis Pt-1C-BFP]|uniref:Meiotically up-regulated gene 190 protein n=1 Tax=Pyrenophora tritici-repentis (strain Pt-1C-BFP) TaxID=426418 RepID=B2W7D4_PYRTR|nr:meiotically up-regulated gene 190 protein [Pyrenophora tritici-repentis Pt-1C-BFP]EDU48642.1 meiotically up-regulated gene 190 protein [Pyrenophora tritici-repentis Pt-1C-BFP]